jgi:hypothetical protein
LYRLSSLAQSAEQIEAINADFTICGACSYNKIVKSRPFFLEGTNLNNNITESVTGTRLLLVLEKNQQVLHH